jgi:hypothetical protein
LQGGGQEFESPRLHQLREPISGGSDPAPGQHSSITEDSGLTPGTTETTKALFIRRLRGKVLEPSSRVHHRRSLDPWPPRPEFTDQRTAGSPPGNGRSSPRRAAPLQLECCSAVNRSSISPSQTRIRSRSIPPATGRQVNCWEGSSYKGHGVDALAPRADEGRGRLRKASGSREQTLIRRCPNGETRLG